ncbi:hypothetical protein FPQ18DRAFT_389313 [Pyronema domesticum]|nr:hypothetical protein FPQ18DRAFT_389313 [Pyronema domesticum]
MDPVTIGKSIIALIDAGQKVTNFISSINSAPAELHKLNLETATLRIVLRKLQDLFDDFNSSNSGDGTYQHRSVVTLEDLIIPITACLFSFEQLSKILFSPFLELLGSNESPSTVSSIWRSTLWVFKAKQVEGILSDLQRQQTSLNTMFSIFACKSLNEARSQQARLIHQNEELLTMRQEFASRIDMSSIDPFQGTQTSSRHSSNSNVDDEGHATTPLNDEAFELGQPLLDTASIGPT